jgi:hypothetical protein
MSDNFLREIDEEVRRDKAAELWKRYGNVVIGALLVLVVAVASWRFYEYRQQQAAQAVSARLESALKASREQRGEEAEKALADIVGAAPAGYQLVARFRLAAEVARRDAEEGLKLFTTLADDAAIQPVFRDLARIRAALLRVDMVPYAELRGAVEPLAAAGGVFRHTAREVLGVSALKAGNLDEAGRWFDQIVTDREAPQGLRQRADLYLALVRAGPVEIK